MQNNFLTKISHEIRTPLNAIIGFGYLCQQTRLDNQQRKYVTSMIDSAKGLLDSFQEMLDFSKLEDDNFDVCSLPFRLETLLQDVSATIEPRCQERSLRFSTNLDENLPPILEGDSKNISLILLNLSSNAVKFTEKGSVQINIDLIKKTADEHMVRFSVIDTGIGVAEDQYENIFLPFTQVDNSHTREYGGTGLGLAVCSLLVQRMNGTICVKANENAGSIFSFTLPLKLAQEVELVQAGPLSGVNALVVENNALSQQRLQSQLTALGMNVECANAGEVALYMIADAEELKKPYQAIILSWELPDMSGVEVAHYINDATLEKKPVLFLQSEFALDEVQEKAKDAGISTIISANAPNSVWQEKIEAALAEQDDAQKSAEVTESIDADEDDGPPRILLVEDNEINQEIAYEVLTTAQLTVDIANNGQEAVDAVAKQKYALVLMDVQMPIMDGLEATRRIREAGYTMPIIAMTAHAMLDDKEASKDAGMNAHLTKPLEPMALFATINAWLPSKTTTKKSSSQAKDVIPARKDKLPERIEGFNIIGGLATVGGNEMLYASLLKKFATRYATINEDISSCLQTNDIEAAVRHAHTVRGIAANLGAEELAKAAENLERALIHSPSMVTPHLRTLVVSLSNAVNAIRESLDFMDASSNAGGTATIEEKLNPAEREHARYVLEQAILYMENDWGHAVDTVQLLLKRLEGTKIESLLQDLLQAVEDFEVEKALEISKIIQEALSSPSVK